MLAMVARTPRGIMIPASSLTTIASKLAPTGGAGRGKATQNSYKIRRLPAVNMAIGRI